MKKLTCILLLGALFTQAITVQAFSWSSLFTGLQQSYQNNSKYYLAGGIAALLGISAYLGYKYKQSPHKGANSNTYEPAFQLISTSDGKKEYRVQKIDLTIADAILDIMGFKDQPRKDAHKLLKTHLTNFIKGTEPKQVTWYDLRHSTAGFVPHVFTDKAGNRLTVNVKETILFIVTRRTGNSSKPLPSHKPTNDVIDIHCNKAFETSPPQPILDYTFNELPEMARAEVRRFLVEALNVTHEKTDITPGGTCHIHTKEDAVQSNATFSRKYRILLPTGYMSPKEEPILATISLKNKALSIKITITKRPFIGKWH